MLFNAPEFLFAFLPVTLIGFFVLGGLGMTRPALAWLVAASFFFYGWWNPPYVVLILFSVVFNYFLGGLITARRQDERVRLRLLVFGVVVNLGLIAYFKYAGFFLSTVNTLAGTAWDAGAIILPIGISFFTFQQIAYLVDAARDEAHEHNFLNYALFVTFFPQLIAGPIVHHKDVLPQFARERTFHPSIVNLTVGGTIFILGLFKKVVLADNLALVASPVFSAAEAGDSLHFFQAWEGALAYTFQLYFDFSGYSDMAIGLARLFGVRLPLNFHSPYKATSIIDFWRRWHMTLSRFLRDYLYFALGGNRRGPVRRHVNLLVTMVLGGLWHGAGWTFVFWGGLHGLYLVFNHGWRHLFRRRVNTWWSRGIARTVTFLAVVLAWVFFRAETFGGALAVLEGMVNLPVTLVGRLGPLVEPLHALGLRFDGPPIAPENLETLAWLGFWLAVVWGLPNTQQIMARYRPALGRFDRAAVDRRGRWRRALAWRLTWRPTVPWAALTACLAMAALWSLQQVTAFLYFQF